MPGLLKALSIYLQLLSFIFDHRIYFGVRTTGITMGFVRDLGKIVTEMFDNNHSWEVCPGGLVLSLSTYPEKGYLA